MNSTLMPALRLCCLILPLLGASLPSTLLHAHGIGEIEASPRADQKVLEPAELRELLGRTALVDQQGERFMLAELPGHPAVLLNFMFTECLDVCPLQTAQLAELQRRLDGTVPEGALRLMSISLTPKHDTPARLLDYGNRYRVDFANWTFATGERDDITKIVTALQIERGKPVDGQVDHRTILYLLDETLAPVQRYRSAPVDVERLERELQAFVTAQAE